MIRKINIISNYVTINNQKIQVNDTVILLISVLYRGFLRTSYYVRTEQDIYVQHQGYRSQTVGQEPGCD